MIMTDRIRKLQGDLLYMEPMWLLMITLLLRIFCITTYLVTRLFKTVQAKFCRKFNFNNYSQNSQISRSVHKSQSTGSVNSLNKKAENSRSRRSWLQDVLRIWMQCEILWEGVRKSPSKDVPKNLVFYVHRCKESWKRIFICTHTESKTSINSHQLTWSFLSQ